MPPLESLEPASSPSVSCVRAREEKPPPARPVGLVAPLPSHWDGFALTWLAGSSSGSTVRVVCQEESLNSNLYPNLRQAMVPLMDQVWVVPPQQATGLGIGDDLWQTL